MTLSELYYSKPRPLTDKGECHDYIDSYYTHEFTNKRDLPIKLLEIGLFKGGSAELWSEWFINADLYGIEIAPLSVDRMHVYIGDAYSQQTVDRYQDNFFDYIIDDGPHYIESQVLAIDLWLSKLKIGGKLIIEDVSSIDFIHLLEEAAIRQNATWKVFDMRNNKGRYRFDDIIFEVTRNG